MRRSRHGRDLMRSFSIAGLCLFALVTMPALAGQNAAAPNTLTAAERADGRSEEHTSELQSLMRISSAVFCLKKTHLPTTTFSISITYPLEIALTLITYQVDSSIT